MLHCPFLLPRSCSRRFPGGTRSVSTIVAAASMSSLRNATLAMGANRRLSPVSYSSCVALHLNDEIICIVYYAPHNMSMGRTRNLKSDARAVNNTQTGLLQRLRAVPNHSNHSERRQDGISTEAVGRAAQAGASVALSQLDNEWRGRGGGVSAACVFLPQGCRRAEPMVAGEAGGRSQAEE